MLRKNDTDPQGGLPGGAKRSFLVRHWKAAALLLVLLLAAAFFLLSRLKSRPAGGTETTAEYVEVQPQRRSISNTFSNSGTITAADSYNVTALVQGTVLTADFEVGDQVQEGDVLYTIDSSDAMNSLEQAQINLEQAQASYEEALDAQYVQASVGGTLVNFNVRTGDLVQAGQELATIRDDSVLLLSLSFPAADAAGFTVGQSAEVTVSGTFEHLAGTVESVSGTNGSSGGIPSCTVTIAVNNPGSLTTTQAAAAMVGGVSSLDAACFVCQRQQTVTASSSGTVEALCVTPGSRVEKGTALVQLSDDSLEKQVQNASNTLRNAQLSYENAQEQLEDYTITAPISGVIVQKNVKAGESISTGGSSATTLCIIYDMDYLEMTLNVDELDIRSIEEGQSVTVTADAVSERSYSGVVTSVLVTGSTTGGTTTYPVTVRIDDTEELMPGMNATAVIQVASAQDALCVPSAALVRGSYLLVTEDSPSAANAVAEMKAPEGYVYIQVETGVSDDDYIQITSGLQEEDTVAYNASLMVSSDSDEFSMGGFGGGMGGGFGGPTGGMGGGPGGGMR